MGRRLFTVAAVASAVLCAGVCVLWVRSYHRADTVGWYGPPYAAASIRQYWALSTGRGGLAVYVQTHWLGQIEPFPFSPTGFAADSSDAPGYAGEGLSTETTLGFAAIRFEPIRTRGIVLPAWFLALACAAVPVRWVVTESVRRQRVRRGLCVRCGYPLWATPDRCPECGTVPAGRAKGAA